MGVRKNKGCPSCGCAVFYDDLDNRWECLNPACDWHKREVRN